MPSRLTSPCHYPPKVWRRIEKECFLTLRGHTDWVTRAVFDNEGLMVVSSSYDKHAKLWRLSDGEEQLTFYGHESWVSDVVFSPEGRSIATASGDFTVRLWQVRSSYVCSPCRHCATLGGVGAQRERTHGLGGRGGRRVGRGVMVSEWVG